MEGLLRCHLILPQKHMRISCMYPFLEQLAPASSSVLLHAKQCHCFPIKPVLQLCEGQHNKTDKRNPLSQRSRSLEPETRVSGNWRSEFLSGAGKALPQASVLCPILYVVVFRSMQHSPITKPVLKAPSERTSVTLPSTAGPLSRKSPPEVLNQHMTSGEASEHCQSP